MSMATSRSGSSSQRALRAERCICLVAVVAVALTLGACSRSATPHVDSPVAAKPKAATSAPRRADDASEADLVSAAGSGGANVPISVKFRLGKRPQLGVPLQIVLSILPAPDVQIAHLHASFLTDNGLNLQGDRTLDVNDVHAGEPLERQLTVIPEQPGVLNLNATFTLDLDTGSVSRSYAIPVIVSDNSS